MTRKKDKLGEETAKRLPMLSVRDLVVERRSLWRNTDPLLKDLNFAADKEEVIALCGEEGSGKSLLSKMILGIPGTGARISSGQIIVNQQEIGKLGRAAMAPIRRKQLFYFSSDIRSQLNSETMVRQYLRDLIALSNRSLMYGNEANWSPVFYQAGIVDPEKILHLKCGDLKPVTVLRLMLVSAVFVGAKVIIADEPAAQLDCLERSIFYQNLSCVAKERKVAVVLSSGHFRGVDRIADRVHILFRGRILESGKPRDLQKNPEFTYTRDFIDCDPHPRRKEKRLPVPDQKAISEAGQAHGSAENRRDPN